MPLSHRRLLVGLLLSALGAQALSQSVSTIAPKPASLTTADPSELWPQVAGVATVYYLIDAQSDPDATAKIEAAIAISNADFPNVLQWEPWTSADGPNYVDINLSASDKSGVCEANEGYEGIPAQPMTGSTNCTTGTILHEMGHIIGLLHEHTRPDRNSYVSVSYANVIKSVWPSSSYAIATDDQQTLEPYDYASVMQYIPFAFSRNGGPVIESIPAGIPMAGYEGVPSQPDGSGQPAQPVYDYSAGDKEAIARLYGAAPTEVTVTSNPSGLAVIVDGATVTTPQTYAWPLWSTHTLDVPSDVQMISGYVLNSNPLQAATFYYTYGRWNDSAVQSHTIQVLPGDGSPRFPSSSPLLATYSANFIQLVPYTTPDIYPPEAAGSTATVSPSPQSYTGSGLEFFVARQEVTLTATPASGWGFYEFNNAPFWLPGALGANPKTFYVPDTGNPVDPTAEFSNEPIYTINVTPVAFSSNLHATVDGQFVYTPKNFSPLYDPSWTSGSKGHTVSVDTDEVPYSFDSRYAFTKWSDGGAQSHTLAALPKVAKTYTATLAPQYLPWTNFNFPPCGGTASLSPASPTNDGFYPSGQHLSLTATPDSADGWVFAGFTYDVKGTTNPGALTASGESLVYANFNTVSAPLALTVLTPKSAKVGTQKLSLKLTGTGFWSHSLVFVNGTYHPLVSNPNAQTLTVALTAADLAEPGGIQVYVENFPLGWNGCAVFAYQTFLVTGAGAKTATPVLAPKAGTHKSPVTVTITDLAPSPTTIYVTTDGTTPTTSSPTYSGPFMVTTTTTVKARALSRGYTLSAVASAKYTIN